MMELWASAIPEDNLLLAITPVAFQRYFEPSVRAEKVIGLDGNGQHCFYLHTFTMSEERFDVDEFPILVDVYYERVVAWRQSSGQWMKVKSYSDQLDSCNHHLKVLPMEEISTMPR
ncbi:MAG TPA: hypothetical protein VGJ90_09860 [Methylophilaceae bacterium]|jgi:hypothetical protein